MSDLPLYKYTGFGIRPSNSPNLPVPDASVASDLETAEARARRALGLIGQARTTQPPRSVSFHDRQKRRFAQDGEVPVVVINSRRDHPADMPAPGALPVNRLEIVETALKAELEARQRTERSLAEAQATIRNLETKLGHIELAKQEAAATARQAQVAQHELGIALAAERGARQKAEETLQTALADREPAEGPGRPHVARDAVEAPVRRRGRPPGSKNRPKGYATLPDQKVEVLQKRAAPEEAAEIRGVEMPTKLTTKKASSVRRPPTTTATNRRAKPREPQPVKWWLTSKKAGGQAGR